MNLPGHGPGLPVGQQPFPLPPFGRARQLLGQPQELDVRQGYHLAARTPTPPTVGTARPAWPTTGARVLLPLKISGRDPLLVRTPYPRQLLVDHVGPARAVRGQFTPVQLRPGQDHQILGRVAEPVDEL
ncbi:hypothetical protein [Streptomyces beihaiensis]|uniref:Uncharacterized protein n=1 Tax=Streptomyces beihaiensis TaxID=2984495 RepID=A0ABT3TXY0_9ACTN|nr:hypothetical protein [Streptomyces beihaiensis]MCX3061880.1 hypothetical protein [Streptomyces beihaiensis]